MQKTTQTYIFPSTRYQGSKAKLVNWIWQQVSNLEFTTVLDAFGGTGAVSYLFKTNTKRVTYNDLLNFNYNIALALIENKNIYLSDEDVNWILKKHSQIKYSNFIESNFSSIYFTDNENILIDQIITNINNLSDKYKFAMAFFALCQSCIVKRPYNLFHRKNLYIRLADVKRSFGNKTTWERPFDQCFREFTGEVNQAIFDNGEENICFNTDVMLVEGNYDLVYIDPPYISSKGVATDYLGFYHFLEGLACYFDWKDKIDYKSKHHRFIPQINFWTDKKKNLQAFDRLFKRYRDSILVLSYRSDGIPSESELLELMRRYKKEVYVEYYGKYQYVLSKNRNSQEILLIGL